MKNSSLFFILSVSLAFPGLTTGCAAVKKIEAYQRAQQEDLELRKSCYLALKRDIATNDLRNGAESSMIKEKYGAPDDIFYSNSSSSSFQIWTYNISKDQLGDTRFDPIILYINNDTLISWKY